LAGLKEPPHYQKEPDAYSFMQAQRRSYGTGSLSKERIALIEQIDWWQWE
jgi:uncharacterized protein (DUF2252 family)